MSSLVKPSSGQNTLVRLLRVKVSVGIKHGVDMGFWLGRDTCCAGWPAAGSFLPQPAVVIVY
jgi:hypothetical protein